MTDRMDARRRILIVAYRRYLTADRALQAARVTAAGWFPEAPARGTDLIGNPGSRLRHLYDARERALVRLTLVREALRDADLRASRRSVRRIYLIEARRTPAP